VIGRRRPTTAPPRQRDRSPGLNPNGDNYQTASGRHIGVPYALIPLYKGPRPCHASPIWASRFRAAYRAMQASTTRPVFNAGLHQSGFGVWHPSWRDDCAAPPRATVTANTSITRYTLFQSWRLGLPFALITASGGATNPCHHPRQGLFRPRGSIPKTSLVANREFTNRVCGPAATLYQPSLDSSTAAGTFLPQVATNDVSSGRRRPS